VRLGRVGAERLDELVTDAWRMRREAWRAPDPKVRSTTRTRARSRRSGARSGPAP